MITPTQSPSVKSGYKQTEVGVIPEEWEVRQIVELCAYQNGKSLEHLFTEDDGLKVISIGNYSVTGSYIDNGVHIHRKHRKQVEKFVLSRNDLTMSLNDKTSVGAIIGRVLLIQEDDLFVFNQRTMRLRPKHNVSPSYLHHAINADRVHGSIVGLAKPGTQIYVNTNDVIELRLPTPPLPEQRAIAEALSDVDGLLGGLERLIAKKRDIKQAAMQQLLTGKTRLPNFHGKWEVKRLGDVAAVSKGTQLHSSETDEGGKFAHLNGGITPSSYTHKSNTDGNTIAISEGGNSCGFVQFMTEPYWCGGHCYSVIPNGVDNYFLYHALKGQQSAIMGLRVGSGLPNVQKTGLLDFEIQLPSTLSEQTAIAEVLTEMDGELAALEQRRDKTRAIKQAMMQELLTGKTRLI